MDKNEERNLPTPTNNVEEAKKIEEALNFASLKIDRNLIKEIHEYEQENDYGKEEYKLKILNLTPEKIEKRASQMNFRLREGNGECIYQIGVEDNGNPRGLNDAELAGTLETLNMITKKIDATMTVLSYTQGKEGLIAEILVTKQMEMDKLGKPEIKIGMIGEECSGKSTLVNIIFLP